MADTKLPLTIWFRAMHLMSSTKQCISGVVALEVVSSFSNAEAEAFRDAHIAPGAQVHTDGTPAFHVFGEGGRTHVATVTGGKRPERDR